MRRDIDALAIAAIFSMVIVGMVVTIDMLQDGRLDPALLALFVSVLSPLVPALIIRHQRKDEPDD